MLVVSDKDDKLREKKTKNKKNAMLARVGHSCGSLNIQKVSFLNKLWYRVKFGIIG